MNRRISKKTIRKIWTSVFILGGIILAIFGMKQGFKVLKPKPFKYVLFDINPCVQFILDDENKIKEVITLNEEADIVLMGTEIINETVEKGTVVFLQYAIHRGYIDLYDIDNELTIITYASDKKVQKEIDNNVKQRAKLLFQLMIVNVEINEPEISRQVKLLAKKNNITEEKVLIINKIWEIDNSLDKDKLMKVSNKSLLKTIKKAALKKYDQDRLSNEEYLKGVEQKQKTLRKQTKAKEQQVLEDILNNYEDYKDKIPAIVDEELKIKKLLEVKRRDIVDKIKNN